MIYRNPTPTTDCIIEYEGGIVIITRKNEPHGYALPGGYYEIGITAEENAVKEAKEETGLDIVITSLHGVYTDPKRDPRQHNISICYIASGSGTLKADSDAMNAAVYSFDKVRQMIETETFAFDHDKILADYLARVDAR
ncbi:MAG: NUDIX hydrolase [Nanoarchaeota archaeon]